MPIYRYEMKVRTLIFNFKCENSIEERGDKLRGHFASRFGEYALIHHHINDNRLLYKSPLIQYKILDGNPFVLGINEGADVLQKIHEDIDYLRIGHKDQQIIEKKISLQTDVFGTSESPEIYSFLTTWLALNKKNYETYQRLGTNAKRNEMLEKILVGNIISMSKGLRYTVQDPIQANIIKIKEVRTSLKGTPMLGFLGTFSVNFYIPDYWGIGKSVSRGFGTVKRV